MLSKTHICTVSKFCNSPLLPLYSVRHIICCCIQYYLLDNKNKLVVGDQISCSVIGKRIALFTLTLSMFEMKELSLSASGLNAAKVHNLA